jgi:hypothetical protein
MMKKKGSRIGMAEVEGCLLKDGCFIINLYVMQMYVPVFVT